MPCKTVYIVVAWLHDMCDDDGIPEASCFSTLESAMLYEEKMLESASCTHIYKREVDVGTPFDYEAARQNPPIDRDTMIRARIQRLNSELGMV